MAASVGPKIAGYETILKRTGCALNLSILAISINATNLQQAEDILDVAVAANDRSAHDIAILLDRQGGLAILNQQAGRCPP
jgi:hypothetical protein